MKVQKIINLLLRLSACLVLGLLCVLLTSRWWLPPVLPRLAGWWSVELASVERLDGGRLRFSDLAMDLDAASVQIDRVELPSEWGYLWERFFGEWSEATVLRIGRVQILAKEKTSPDEVKSESVYLPQIQQQVLQGLNVVDRWLPRLELASLEYRDETQVIAVVEAFEYQGRRFAGRGSFEALPGQWEVVAELESEAPWEFGFSQAGWGLSGTFQLEGDGQQVSLKGTLAREGSQLELAAHFGDSSWLPTAASVASDGVDLTGIGLPLNSNLSLADLRLNQIQAEWDDENYRFRSAGQALVQSPDEVDQAVKFELSGSGDMDALRLEAATLVSDWANLELSEPLMIDFRQRSFLGEARLRAQADLGKQPWFEAVGRVEAELRVKAESLDALHFDLRGENLAYTNFEARSIEAKGWLDFEKLHLDSLTLRPTDTDSGEVLKLSGTADFEASTVDLNYSAWLGAGWVNRMIGQTLLVEPLELEAGQISGPWRSPEVSGEVRTAVQTEAIEPVQLSANLRWDGQQQVTWAATVRCNGAEIETEASASLGQDVWAMRLESLRWSDPERPELILESPVDLSWQRAEGSIETRVSVSALVLKGEDMEASVAYAPSQGLELLLKNVSLARIDRWVQAELPVYYVELVACTLTEFRPFLAGAVQIAVEERIDAAVLARLELSADLEERLIAIRELAVRFSGEELLQGNLELPLRLQLPLPQADATGAKQPFYALTGSGLRGQLVGNATPKFAAWLESRTSLRLGEASVDMNLSGDLSRPIGHLNLQTAELGYTADLIDRPLPGIYGLELQLQVDERLIDVQKLNFSLNQSGVQAAFSMPTDALVAAVDATAFDPQQLLGVASGEVRLEAWQMENWLDWVPPYFRRSGSLSGSLKLAPELQLSGQLRFEDFGLRPTASLASIDQIEGQLRLDNRLLTIDQASARVGGSRVELAGELNLTDLKQPQWFFTLNGSKVPVVRTTEMILRSDLDLRVEARDPALQPLVAGTLNLQSSTLLVDFDPLAPRLKKGTAARPPFFNITEEPLAKWRFDLKITGDRFMRVRSPYFKTLLSADMELTGTFAEPLLLGSVRTLDAELHFPGAKFVINEGEALIEASRPNEVQLAFNGIAQKSSKVIVMEVSQTLEDPLIHFESTPPMSQADIVRLLATGSTVGGGVGNLGIYLGQGMLGAGGMNESFADKLTVDVGEEVSRSGRKTIGARYEFTPRWSAEGGYDVFDAYNADLIWTIFKR